MLVRFVPTLVVVLGFGVAMPVQPALAQEKPTAVKKFVNNDDSLVKADHEARKPEPQPAPPKSTMKAKAPGKPAAALTRGASPRAQRSAAARQAFERQTGYPNGRPGYLVEHIVPLSCGGADTPGNMQWFTLAEARRKNKLESTRCR